jgi:hypothetical protein
MEMEKTVAASSKAPVHAKVWKMRDGLMGSGLSELKVFGKLAASTIEVHPCAGS